MSTSSPAAQRPSGPAGAARPTKDRTTDLVITIVELIVLVLGGFALSMAGLFLVMASDSCGVVNECDTGLIALGVAVAVLAPWVAILGLGSWAVVRLVRRRSAWWVALLAFPAAGLLFALGVAMTFSGAGAA